jgi:hypothetical protein
MKKIAIIFTGDIRNCSALNEIETQFKNFDVFIGSYIKHINYIQKIGKKKILSSY